MKDEAEQYRLLLENRRPRGPLSLGELSPRARLWLKRGRNIRSPLDAVVGQAAKRLRRQQAATKAWEQVAQPEWLQEARVDGIAGKAGDMAVILVSGSPLCYELRRKKATLERQLSKLAPGVRQMRFVVAGQSDTQDDGVADSSPPQK
ncbi:MAG: hypothetical protein KAY37_02995 [Phycisphaerae bacterium]|nr:hypothetical protein [Phycisphaerae bacterium]